MTYVRRSFSITRIFTPVKEYLIRKNELDRYAQSLGIRVIDGDYRHDLWRLAVIGLEKEPERGRRCLACFKHRLLVTAECAKREGIELYTTTLARIPMEESRTN